MDTIVERMSKLSVELNGIIWPGTAVEKVLARYAFNLFVHNDDPTYKISLLGSATAVRFRGRYLLLATQHQLVGTELERISMMSDDGEVAITSGGVRSYRMSSETDAFDLIAFDFTEPCAARPDLRPRFFDLTRIPPNVVDKAIIAFLLTGYPFKDQRYEVHETNQLGLARRLVTCLPESQPSDDALLSVRSTTPLPHDPDGMSGGSAFVVQESNGQFDAYFAGIIVRGGREIFHVIKAGYVFSFLSSAFKG